MKQMTLLGHISMALILLAWIGKLHFVAFGDALFCFGTVLFATAQCLIALQAAKTLPAEYVAFQNLFTFNGVALGVVSICIMLKVAHLFQNQLWKDIALDFVGLPIILFSLILNGSRIPLLLSATPDGKAQFGQHILAKWGFVFFSLLFYAVYSAALAVAVK